MGCAQSRIENEEVVSRCRERKQLMRDTVAARAVLAAVHSAHAAALKNAGAALSEYGEGEVETHVREESPPSPPPAAKRQQDASMLSSASNSELFADSILLPPPPLPFSPAPLTRTTSVPEHLLSRPEPATPVTIRNEHGADATSWRGEGAMENEPVTPVSPLLPPSMPGRDSDGARATDLWPEPKSVDAWDFFSIQEDLQGPTLGQIEEGEEIKNVGERIENTEEEEKLKGGQDEQFEGRGTMDDDEKNVEKTPEKVSMKPPIEIEEMESGIGESVASESSENAKIPAKSLLQILNELDEQFLKASEGAHEVSRMLEANRLHYYSNFTTNQGNVDLSATVMRAITWNKSSKNTSSGAGKDAFVRDEWETHATVLDKLLAWEKKLYDEVKEGELMKHEYQRKVALLKKQKKRGSNPDALERTKAAVCHLHTRYVVDMQSLDSTVLEIQQMRDRQLYPKLAELVNGIAIMWETMHSSHNKQLMILRDVKVIDISNAPKETTSQHHNKTRQLCSILGDWHSQFDKLMTQQKEYLQALNSWLKLSLIPIESGLKEKMPLPTPVQQPPIQLLLRSWLEQLEKLPFELARSAISSFAAVMNTILENQEEELKQKNKYEETKKEYLRKHRVFEEWYQKYLQRKLPQSSSASASASVEVDQDRVEAGTNPNDPVAEKQFVVESLKKRLDEETETYQKLCRQVREKSLASLERHLPELFRSISDFALASFEMYKKLKALPEPNLDESNA